MLGQVFFIEAAQCGFYKKDLNHPGAQRHAIVQILNLAKGE
jgi:hypothetical protein